jgi:hypothetical protein
VAAGHDNLAWLPINAADLSDELTVCDVTDCSRIEHRARRHRQLRAEFSRRRSTNRGDGHRVSLPIKLKEASGLKWRALNPRGHILMSCAAGAGFCAGRRG